LHIRNAPTKLMKELDYGKDYKYAHDHPGAYIAQEYLPEKLQKKTFYSPKGMGFEEMIKDRIALWKKMKKQSDGDNT